MNAPVPVLSIENLSVEYPLANGRTLRAVDDVSLTILPGEIHALVGESGAGKTTVGNAVMGLLEAPGRIVAGSIRISGQDLSLPGQKAGSVIRGRDIGAVFQDPMTSLNPLFTIGNQLTETTRFHLGLDAKTARRRAIDLLRLVGISEPERRFASYPHQMSGGQRQRVVIAAALSCEPRLVVADEPTTALDVSVQAQILTLIRRLTVDRGLGVLLVTHNMGVVAQVADHLTIMHRGKVVEAGETERLLNSPQNDYARNLISSVPRLDIRTERFPVFGDESDIAVRARGLLQKRAQRLSDSSGASEPLLNLESLTVEYTRGWRPGSRRAFRAVDAVDLSIRRGEIVGVVGESGCGKTTLANAIGGLVKPTAGRISFQGRVLDLGRRGPERRAIQMIFQDPYSSLNPRMQISKALAEPIRFYGRAATRAEAVRNAESLLEAVGLDASTGDRYPHAFSGGQRQRISLARALAAEPSLLICDEPTSSLDVSVQARILNLLKDLRDATGLTMLFISHDLAVVRQMCDRIAVMLAGRIVEVADAEKIFVAPQHEYTRHLLSCVPSVSERSRFFSQPRSTALSRDLAPVERR
jgi:peptide/nickel transport system ATP-binding protein